MLPWVLMEVSPLPYMYKCITSLIHIDWIACILSYYTESPVHYMYCTFFLHTSATFETTLDYSTMRTTKFTTLTTHHAIIKGEDADISAMMDVIVSHDWLGMILHPNSCQSIPTNLIVFVYALCIIRDVKSYVLTHGDITVFDVRFSTSSRYTHSCPNWKLIN